MWVFVSKYLVPKGYRGITVFPFIFLAKSEDAEDKILLNHEKIHIRQQIEMLVVLFFVWYGIEFLFKWFVYKDKRKAYLNVSFEREAYLNEKDLFFLKKRSFLFFTRFI